MVFVESYLSKKLPSRDDVRDGFQDIIVLSIAFSPRIRDGSKLQNVVHRISKGVVAKYYRSPNNGKNVSFPVLHLEDSPYDTELIAMDDTSNRPDEVLQRKEVVSFVRKSLKPQLAKVFIMRYYEGLSLGEIANELKISLATVNRKLLEAHNKLSETTERLGLKSCMFL